MKPMHLIGKTYSLVFRIPVIGEPLLRAILKSVAYLFFHLPYTGGKRHRNAIEVRTGWFRFLSRFGIFPEVTHEDENEFRWFVKACPYGFARASDKDLCDAVMDLDRTYTRLLGGEMEILDRIPHGAECCRYLTRLQHAKRGQAVTINPAQG